MALEDKSVYRNTLQGVQGSQYMQINSLPTKEVVACSVNVLGYGRASRKSSLSGIRCA